VLTTGFYLVIASHLCDVPSSLTEKQRDLGYSISEQAGRSLGALLHGHVGPLIVTEIDLPGTRDILFRIEQHFLPLRDPAAGARNGEQDGEHGHRETHGLID
jgi:hypothetical protein